MLLIGKTRQSRYLTLELKRLSPSSQRFDDFLLFRCFASFLCWKYIVCTLKTPYNMFVRKSAIKHLLTDVYTLHMFLVDFLANRSAAF